MLTDTACRKAICGEKDRKMFDERGLYLLVRASGSKLWRMKYRYAVKKKSVTGKYAAAILGRLELHAFPSLGRLPIRSITPPVVLEMIRKIEKRGAHDVAHRVRNHVSEVFVWSIASGLAETDPAAIIQQGPRSNRSTAKAGGARSGLRTQAADGRGGIAGLALVDAAGIPAEKMKLTKSQNRDITWEFVIPLSC